MRDVFVTHDWRNTPEQEAALDLLDQAYGLAWRNFGTPWYDPTVDWHAPKGRAFLTEMLSTQIIPARLLLVLAGLCDSQRGDIWVREAIRIAREHGLPVVGLPPHGAAQAPEALRSLVDVWVPWDPTALAATLERLDPTATAA